MSQILRRQFAYCGALLFLVIAGCAANSAYHVKTRVNDDFSFYEPFDNSRDWGPDYLVGPPRPVSARPITDDRSAVMQSQSIPSIPTRPLPSLP